MSVDYREEDKAAKRQELMRRAALPQDQLESETKAYSLQMCRAGAGPSVGCLLVLGAIFANGGLLSRIASGVVVCFVVWVNVSWAKSALLSDGNARRDYLTGRSIHPVGYDPYPNGLIHVPGDVDRSASADLLCASYDVDRPPTCMESAVRFAQLQDTAEGMLFADFENAVRFARSNDRWEVAKTAALRTECALDSRVVGQLERGEIIENLETAHDGGIVCIRCDGGWTSVTSKSGNTLLRPVIQSGVVVAHSAEVALIDNPTCINGSTARVYDV